MNIPGNSGPPPCHFVFAKAVYLPLMPPLDQTCGAGKSEALSQAVRRGRRGGRGGGGGPCWEKDQGERR